MKTAAAISSGVPGIVSPGIEGKVSPFIAACLAPLPAGEKPADSKAFRRLLENDKMAAWNAALEQVRYCEALHTAAAIVSLRGPVSNEAQIACFEAWQAARAARADLCRVPAPTAKELKYKLRHLARDADDAGKRQIKADRERFAAETAA